MTRVWCITFGAKDDNYFRYITCEGSWCDRCKAKYKCYTSSEDTIFNVWPITLGLTERDDCWQDKIQTKMQLFLVGIETDSIYIVEYVAGYPFPQEQRKRERWWG